MENRKGKRSFAAMSMGNLAIVLIISLAFVPEVTIAFARHHIHPSLLTPKPQPSPPRYTPPSPHKSQTYAGNVYYLPPNGI